MSERNRLLAMDAAARLLDALAEADPLVLVIDDLQWAGAGSVGFVDAVFSSGGLPGVLLVCAYRDAEVTDAHPLQTLIASVGTATSVNSGSNRTHGVPRPHSNRSSTQEFIADS